VRRRSPFRRAITDAQRARAHRDQYAPEDFDKDRQAAVAAAAVRATVYVADRWDLVPGRAITLRRIGAGKPRELKVPRLDFWPRGLPPGWKVAG
jgi:hypothetical protein